MNNVLVASLFLYTSLCVGMQQNNGRTPRQLEEAIEMTETTHSLSNERVTEGRCYHCSTELKQLVIDCGVPCCMLSVVLLIVILSIWAK